MKLADRLRFRAADPPRARQPEPIAPSIPEGAALLRSAVIHPRAPTTLCGARYPAAPWPDAIADDLETLGGGGARPVFVDTETTGLREAGVVAFVIGLGFFTDDGALHLRQWTLGQMADEPAMLEAMLEAITEHGDTLVSFNGASFDVPLLRGRLVRLGLPTTALDRPHLDLLTVARRLWAGRLPDCRLGTLEALILGLPRIGDMPAALIPDVFWRWLDARSGDEAEAAADVAQVQAHNLADLAALPSVAAAAAAALRSPADADAALRAARHYVKLDQPRQALDRLRPHVRAKTGAKPGSDPWDDARDPAVDATLFAAEIHRRAGRHGDAALLWSWVCEVMPGHPAAHEALAKHLEHRARRPAAALAVAQRSAQPCPRRLARLERKAGGASAPPGAPGRLPV